MTEEKTLALEQLAVHFITRMYPDELKYSGSTKRRYLFRYKEISIYIPKKLIKESLTP